MYQSNIELIKHILDEINFITEQVSDKEKDFVINDPVFSRAIIEV